MAEFGGKEVALNFVHSWGHLCGKRPLPDLSPQQRIAMEFMDEGTNFLQPVRLFTGEDAKLEDARLVCLSKITDNLTHVDLFRRRYCVV